MALSACLGDSATSSKNRNGVDKFDFKKTDRKRPRWLSYLSSSPLISTTIWHWNSAAIPPIPTPVIQSTLTLASTRRSTTVADFGHGTSLMDEDVCNRLRDVKKNIYCTVRELIWYFCARQIVMVFTSSSYVRKPNNKKASYYTR